MENNELSKLKISYKDIITELKILSIRLEHNGEKEKAVQYRKIIKKLEKIRENAHLSMIDEEKKEKSAYKEILEKIEENQKNNTGNLEMIVQGNFFNELEKIFEKYNINETEEKVTKEENMKDKER